MQRLFYCGVIGLCQPPNKCIITLNLMGLILSQVPSKFLNILHVYQFHAAKSYMLLKQNAAGFCFFNCCAPN